MKQFLKTTLIGGLLFLLPFVVGLLVIGKAISFMMVLAEPIGRLLPIETFAGLAIAQILAIVLLLLICLAAGLIARRGFGTRVAAKLETTLLHVIPGYAWVKGVTGEISDEEAARVFQPVVVKLDDQVQLGLEAGRTENGMVAVFFPGSPDVRSGALAFVEPGRVDKLDATLKDFNSVFTTLGQRRIKGLP